MKRIIIYVLFKYSLTVLFKDLQIAFIFHIKSEGLILGMHGSTILILLAGVAVFGASALDPLTLTPSNERNSKIIPQFRLVKPFHFSRSDVEEWSYRQDVEGAKTDGPHPHCPFSHQRDAIFGFGLQKRIRISKWKLETSVFMGTFHVGTSRRPHRPKHHRLWSLQWKYRHIRSFHCPHYRGSLHRGRKFSLILLIPMWADFRSLTQLKAQKLSESKTMEAKFWRRISLNNSNVRKKKPRKIMGFTWINLATQTKVWIWTVVLDTLKELFFSGRIPWKWRQWLRKYECNARNSDAT